MVLQLVSGAAIWRVRMAALDASRPGWVVQLLNVELGGANEYSWTPTPAQAADLQRYCSTRVAAAQYGTSIWCEDIVGHVCVPDEVQWLRTMVTSVTPDPTPLRSAIPLTVIAKDDETGIVVPGATVTLTNYPTPSGTTVQFPANAPYSITLNTYFQRGPHGTPPNLLEPIAAVRAAHYADAEVDFQFGNLKGA
jgi:hypothetical protein